MATVQRHSDDTWTWPTPAAISAACMDTMRATECAHSAAASAVIMDTTCATATASVGNTCAAAAASVGSACAAGCSSYATKPAGVGRGVGDATH